MIAAQPIPASSQVEFVPTFSLAVHPALQGLPEWSDDDEQFIAFCHDIATRGFDHPLCIDSRKRIVDGRHRWRAAKALKIDSVPVQQVPDENIPELVLHYIIQRRHYPKGALAYMVVPLIRERYKTGAHSFENLAGQFGLSLALLKQARQLREIFETQGELAEQYRAIVEPKILSGDIGLGGALGGWGGFSSTKGKAKNVRDPLDLWDRSFSDLQRRFSTWEKFDAETKTAVAARLSPFVECMPAELLQKLQARIAAELKHRKEER